MAYEIIDKGDIFSVEYFVPVLIVTNKSHFDNSSLVSPVVSLPRSITVSPGSLINFAAFSGLSSPPKKLLDFFAIAVVLITSEYFLNISLIGKNSQLSLIS